MVVSDEEAEAVQHKWRMILAMATLLLCCVATAPCGFVLLNLRQHHVLGKSIFYTGVVTALDMGQCWLLLFFTIPTQLKGDWLFGHSACLVQAFFARLFRGGAYLALLILAVQECRCDPWIRVCGRLVCQSKFHFFVSWAVVGSVSLFPFFVTGAEYTFNVGLSHCDVHSRYIIIHDVITFCVPIILLTILSVRLIMCQMMCLTHGLDSSASRTSSDEMYVDLTIPDRHGTDNEDYEDEEDEDTEGMWITSSHLQGEEEDNEGEGDEKTGRVMSRRRGPYDARTTMTVSILCTETALLLLLEWALRLLGVLMPDITFLACSVLFCCAGQVVRPAALIIIKRAYRASPVTLQSSTFDNVKFRYARDLKIVLGTAKRPRGSERQQQLQQQNPQQQGKTSSLGRVLATESHIGIRGSAGGAAGGGGRKTDSGSGQRPIIPSSGLALAPAKATGKRKGRGVGARETSTLFPPPASASRFSSVSAPPSDRVGVGGVPGPVLSGRAVLRPRVRPPHFRKALSASGDRSDGGGATTARAGGGGDGSQSGGTAGRSSTTTTATTAAAPTSSRRRRRKRRREKNKKEKSCDFSSSCGPYAASPATSLSCLHTVATEDDPWDCSPDKLSSVWINEASRQSGRFQCAPSTADLYVAKP